MQPSQARLRYLDGLRGIAIIAVMLWHFFGPTDAALLPYGDRYSHIPVLSSGWMGVELFFLISGFVIFMTIERCSGFCDFMLRRWLRLFPAMPADVFARGRLNPQEGGPKGIDISKDNGVLVSTCECQTLAFFDLEAVVRLADAPENRLKRYLQWRFSEVVFNRLGYMSRFPA